MKIHHLYYLPALLLICLLIGCGNSQKAHHEQSIFHPLKISDSVRYVGEMSYSGYLSISTNHKIDSVYRDTVFCIKKNEDSIYCIWKRIKILDDTFRNQWFTAPLELQDGDQYLFPDDDKKVRYVLLLRFSKESLDIIDTFATFVENTMDVYHFNGRKLKLKKKAW